MIPRLLCLLVCWNCAAHLGRAQKLPGVKKPSLKVQINATSDTVVLKFLRPTPNLNLEGFILGYGSSFFSTQYIPLPENGKSYDTELDAEPRYLVAVRPSPIVNAKKTCSGQSKVQKPLQVVVGTLTPTSVYLAWGVLVNPQNDWTVLNKCPNDRFYTVRYREKEKNKKWNFQLCPSTETVVDNLKPNIIYEFGVKDNSEDGTWNKGVTHKTTAPPKHKNGGNGHIQNTFPKGHIQEAPEDTKMLVPVTVVKQVVKNISNGKKPKSTVSPALPTSTAVNGTQPLPEILAGPETAKAPAEARQMTREPPTDIPDISPRQPDSTPVSNEPTVLASKEDTAAVSDLHHSKPVQNEIHELPSAKPKAAQTTQRPLPTHVPKKTQRVPINLIHLHVFGDPDTTPVPNETSKAKTVHSTERPQTKNVPKSTHRVPINLIRLHIFEDPSVTRVQNETQKTSFKPTSQTTEIPHVKADSKEFHTESTKPKILTPRPRLQITQAPRKVYTGTSRPKTSARPRTRPVPNRTTQATALPKNSNDLNWISETSIGGKLTGQDITKLLGVSRNTSTEPNGTAKRPLSGSSLPQPRPTYMRRRPFPPNNVTGRPGISGNGLMPRARSASTRYMPRPTQVGVIERTQPPRPRTTSAPERETVTEPVFNANPVSDVDPLGKPRYTAPHVKYMRKEDLVPCSITESMRHFPTEMATNEDEAIIAPQSPPSNLTVVTVEGCPSFVILDWEQPDNDTVTEYKVISKENGGPTGKDQSILTTNQTHSTVENLKPDTSYEFKVIATNIIGEGPPSTTVTHNTESADPRVSEPITGGKDAIWTEIKFKSDTYSECKGKQYVKRTWYKKFVGIQLCNSLRYKIYLSDSLSGKFYNIGDESGYGEDHCQFVDSFLDGRTGQQLYPDQLPSREGFYRSVRQQPVEFGKIGSQTHIRYVHWYECGTTIPGKW